MQQTTPGAGGGGQAQQRELVYRVRVVADTSQANQAFSQMSRQAQGAAGHYPQAGGMAYQPGGGGWAPGQPPPPGGGGAPGGGSGGAAGDKNVSTAAGYAVMMTRLTVAVGFVTTALEKFRGVLDAVNTQGRETVNASAKVDKWFEQVPVVGKPIGDAMNYGFSTYQRWGVNGGTGYGAKAATSGRTLRTQEQLRDGSFGKGLRDFNNSPLGAFAMGGMVVEAALPAAGEFIAAEQEYTDAQDRTFLAPFNEARRQAAREAADRRSALDDEYRGVSEAAGFRADDARSQSRLLFAGRGPNRTRFDSNDEYDAVLRQAARAKASAATGLGMAQEEAFRARTGRQDAAAGITGRAAYDAAQKQVEELKEKAKIDPTIQESDIAIANAAAEQKGTEYAEQLQKYQEALNKEKEKTVSLAQAEYELAQKSLAAEQAKLSVVEAKLKQNDGYAESFAMLNGGQRQGLLDSVKQLNDGDFGSLSPRQREILGGSSITSDYFRKKAREYTNADPEARGQLDELVKMTGQQTRRELTDERNKLQAQVELQFTSNPEQLADQLRKAFKLVDPELRKLIEESLRLERGKIDRQEAAARAQSK